MKAVVTKIINKAASDNNDYSLGFCRYINLTKKAQMGLKTAHYLQTGSTDSQSTVVAFFEGLTEAEYKNWLIANV